MTGVGIGIPIFSVLAVASAALAILFSDTRKVIIASWFAAMSVGGLFLACGAEFLAYVQWIMGTLVAISFIVYATLFGEYGPVDARSLRERIFDALPALVVGAAFFAMIVFAMTGAMTGAMTEAAKGLATSPGTAAAGANDLLAVGRNLVERHLVALELVAFMLLAVLIGSGVISRGEEADGEGAAK